MPERGQRPGRVKAARLASPPLTLAACQTTPPSEIRLADFKLPPGFKAELWAHGIPGIRAMARGDDGKIDAGTRGIGRVDEITDKGSARSHRVVIDKLVQPAGAAFRNGSLYVMAIDKVLRLDGTERGECTNLPLQRRRLGHGGDRARGVRSPVGFDWHPVTKAMWFTNHGRDWMGDDGLEDEFNRMPGTGRNFGFPYGHAGLQRPPGLPAATARRLDAGVGRAAWRGLPHHLWPLKPAGGACWPPRHWG